VDLSCALQYKVRETSVATSIRGVKFDLADRTARELFLRASPSGESIRDFLSQLPIASAVSHRAFYDRASYTATYVTRWRGRTVCLIALKVTSSQAAGIESRLAYAGKGAWLSLPFFQDCVEAALRESINPDHPRGTYLAQWWHPDLTKSPAAECRIG
jgi:hypothetical protein